MKHDTKAMGRLTGLLTSVVVVTGLGVSRPALAAEDCRVCERTAQYAYGASLLDARSEYRIAIGKTMNIGNQPDRADSYRKAKHAFRTDIEDAQAVYEARADLCELLMECRYDPEIDPDEFLSPAEAAASPNPYYPLVPGTVYTYESDTEEGLETIVVEITGNTVEIMDVTCIEVRDTVTLEGEVIEDTLDWYAQHDDGSVWYFGELSFSYSDGEVVSLEGSWKAGVDGAKPGIVMKGTRAVGDAYRQEWLLGEAEDAAQILALDETVMVPAAPGTFLHCVKTLDINPRDPELVEHKYFAPGVGFVFEIKPDDGETVELISVATP